MGILLPVKVKLREGIKVKTKSLYQIVYDALYPYYSHYKKKKNIKIISLQTYVCTDSFEDKLFDEFSSFV